MGIKTLAEQLSVNEKEASEFIESFYSRYSNIRKSIQETINKCRDLGYVETLSGRRRYLPHINHHNTAIKCKYIS